MPEPDKQERLPFERSSIAAIGRRKSWLSVFTGRNGSAEDEGPGRDAGDDERITHSMLGSLAEAAGPAPAPDSESAPRSLLALSGPAAASAPASAEGEPMTPISLHSTLAELAGLEEHPTGAFPVERGILISLGVHLAIVLLLILLPEHEARGSKGDLLAAFYPEPKDESPIPVFFQEAPGPARENPKRSPFSDADRRAGGGDPAKPKSDTPFIPESRGIAGLSPGPKAPRVPGSDAASRPGATAEAERRAAAAGGQAAEEAKPSEFPADMRPQMGSGPREMTRLAGLDQAIREAARGAVGGEGGAPPANPEGGFVDSGPISFDTTWYDWGPYAAEMVRRIKLHWDVPELARLGWKGKLTVRFFILADGTVADAKIIRGSGIPPFDYAAFQAIVKSSPFRPLPADLHSQREGVTVTFFYNLRPEEDGAEARK